MFEINAIFHGHRRTGKIEFGKLSVHSMIQVDKNYTSELLC